MLGFIKNLFGVHAENAADEMVRILVEMDPKSATEAELRTMEDNLDKLGRELALARQSSDNETREAVEIRKLFQQRMAAADRLSEMMNAEENPAKKAELEKSLMTLLAMLEEMGPDIQREEEEAQEAKSFLDTIENAYTEAGARFKAARKELEQAERDMKRADMQKDQAKRQEEQAKRTAGLTRSSDSLGIALKSMRASADQKLAEADAAKRKTTLLTPTAVEKDDRNIAAAMASVTGKGSTSTEGVSLADRIAALKNKS